MTTPAPDADPDRARICQELEDASARLLLFAIHLSEGKPLSLPALHRVVSRLRAIERRGQRRLRRPGR